jgi:ubiquinone/menaquinone biosynthesis C-methylase UbiE
VYDRGEILRARAATLVAAASRATRPPPGWVLDVGCGARLHIAIPPEIRVLGLDVSLAQLRRNTTTPHLAFADAGHLPVATGSMDAAVSWDVLEHLPDPDTALDELARVIRPGGVVVLGLPHVLSLKGVVTRWTPWPVHVWVYRRVLGDASAGTDASDQFPTTLRFSLRPAGLRSTARRLGLEVVWLETYEGPVPRHLRRRHRAADYLLRVARLLSRVLTLGRYDTTASDIVAVLRRPEATAARTTAATP